MAVLGLRQAAAVPSVEMPLLPFEPDFEVLCDDPDFMALTRPGARGEQKNNPATPAH